MPNILSYSQINKWEFCNQAWKYHYVDKFRPVKQPSYFLLGTALDRAIEIIVTGKQGELTNKQIFDYHFTYQHINDVLTNTLEYPDMTYSEKDLDIELLTPEERASGINPYWLSLKYKGHYMIEAFEKNVLPKIKKVHATQEKTKLDNAQGDSNIGYCDLIVDMEGYDNPVIIDIKTSARNYSEDSVRNSVQLAGYMHVLGPKYKTSLAGYIVFDKNINKNKVKTCIKCGHIATGSHKTCEKLDQFYDNRGVRDEIRCGGQWNATVNPTCSVQIIIDTIPEVLEDIVIENMDAVNLQINSGIITRNLSHCIDDGFGRRCSYYKMCYLNDSTGFIKKEITV